MKKSLIILIALMSYIGHSQYNSNAPWMEDLNQNKSSSGQETSLEFQKITNAFNAYWKDKDYKQKGSGYKPFMRWQEYWKNALLPDGTLPSPKHIWKAWEEKNNMPVSSSNAAVNWTPMGPFDHKVTGSWSPGQGRVNVAIIDPNNPNTFYIGAPAGGIWKSTNKGSSWTSLSDHLPQIGVSGIAIDPNNSNIVYISTGDDDASDSYSIGVLKSTDGGNTWTQTGLKFSDSQTTGNDIYIDPSNSNTLWVATSKGVYKTTNAGNTWTRTLNADVKDIKLKPGNANIIYAATKDSFYKSTNGGNSFSKIQSGLPSTSGRLVLEVTPANPNYVYVLSAKTRSSNYSFQGLYRSTNSGDSFSKTQETSNILESSQAWYDLALTVSDTNANTIFVGCINIWKSTNGGNSFSKINNWSSPQQATYTHADIHFLRYYNGKLLCGSDGGVYLSENNGGSFTDLTKGLQIGQFYRISVASNSSSNYLVGGLQDNGGYARKDNIWNNFFGADGMDCAVSGTDPNTYYGFIQNGGGLYRTTNRGTTQSRVAAGPESGNWITPLVSDKNGNIYAGYSNFYKLSGNSLQKLSSYNFGGKLDHIEVDPSNTNTIYVSRKNNLFKSTNKGVNWTKIHTSTTNITSIEVHNGNSNTIYITTSGHSTSGTSNGVFKSTDQGASFSNITGNLPSEAKNVVRHQKGTETIYVGTYLGVYYKQGNGNWENYSQSLPNVSVRDLEVNYGDKVLLAGTYGRGVWKIPLVGSGSTDTQAPSTPTNLTASNPTQNTIDLSWTASTDNVGVSGYDVYQGNTVISTVTTTTYQASGLTADTAYSFRIKAKDAAGNQSGFSNTASATTTGGGNPINYCASNGKDTSYEYIGKVSLGTINKTSNAGTGGYSDFTAESTTLSKGSSNTISVTPSWPRTTAYNEGYSVWIDYNQDGDFADSGEQVWTKSPSTTTPVSGSFTVPSTAKDGKTRMRVSMKYNGIPTPCESFSYGEVEDYTVVIDGSGGSDPCEGVPPYSSTQSYKPGDRVTYNGYLYERTNSNGWKRIGPCGVPSPNFATTTLSDDSIPLHDLNNSDFVIYPNPVKNAIMIQMNNTNNSTYRIVNQIGQEVRKGNVSKNKIELNELPSGMYFISVMSNKKTLTKRFIKQ
ncbi:GEVED domain-containing protein [Aquimarina sediminis]|uniref:GEVED domain-containing protein n=1 Tax=Aquimarina sediminis TaxID=2070536 RepID=UPI0013E8E7D7|nr:GEVED domain-containing protein [Aquimarina sediminis]